MLRYSLYPCASQSRVSSFVCSICILPLPSCFAHSYFNWYTCGPILHRSPVPIPSFQSFRCSVLVILCDKAVGVLCLFREVFSVIGSMFGLGSRKVLKYSAIDTSLSIDVEDTVTCFCRSVFAIMRLRASQPARIRESPLNILPNELSLLPIATNSEGSRICRIELKRCKTEKDFINIM